LLTKEKIPQPQSRLLFKTNKNNFSTIAAELGTPFILKIPDGSFSHDINKISNESELKESLNTLFQKSAILLAQEFIPTPLIGESVCWTMNPCLPVNIIWPKVIGKSIIIRQRKS
jgi:glutathione synthase/RimK-type ligase-like ATP-grasp enzyme